ncbi:MAG: hypothetical protein R3D98_10850 [Candidatus Krumholzibacteriia bacterium]
MKLARLVSGCVLVVLALAAHGGECTWHSEAYFQLLAGDSVEGMDAVDREYYTPSQCFYCLGLPRQNLLRWGVEREKANLFSARKLEYRGRLIGFAEEYIRDPATQVAAATILAYQGIHEVDGYDVFEILADPNARVRQRWYTLASLQDARAVDYADQRYHEIRGESEAVDEFARRQLLDIVDCLFHLKSDESRDLLSRLARQETDTQLTKYIREIAGV